MDSDIQIAAQAQRLLRAVGMDDDDIRNVVDGYNLVASGRIQLNGMDAVDDGKGLNNRSLLFFLFVIVSENEYLHL